VAVWPNERHTDLAVDVDGGGLGARLVRLVRVVATVPGHARWYVLFGESRGTMPPSPPPILDSQATRDWLSSELVNRSGGML
jgi:hypothetical protein